MIESKMRWLNGLNQRYEMMRRLNQRWDDRWSDESNVRWLNQRRNNESKKIKTKMMTKSKMKWLNRMTEKDEINESKMRWWQRWDQRWDDWIKDEMTESKMRWSNQRWDDWIKDQTTDDEMTESKMR